ncbi:MAG: HAMP domain-containing protein [Leptospira sp.]|nr:HAMP domain-containing protein [Leptospira sp.]
MSFSKIQNFFYNWSIQLKLVSIISVIIIVSISGIIYLATYFFKQDNEVRIKEKNLEITELIASKTRSDLSNVIRSAREVAFGVASNRINTIQRRSSIQDVSEVSEGEEIVAIYLYQWNGRPVLDRSSYNYFYLNELKWSKNKIDSIVGKNLKNYSEAINNKTVVRNSSIGDQALMGISHPYRLGAIRFFVVITKMDLIQSSFKGSGITENFLLTEEGVVLAHTNKEVTIKQKDYNELPLLDKIKSSPLNNGQMKYSDKDDVTYIASFKKLGIAGLTVVTNVNEDKAMEEVNNIQRRNFFLMIIILSLSILVVLIYSKKLTKPILKLVDASHQIEKGDFHVELTETSGDEIGILTRSFGNMAKGLSERDKIKDAFGKFVNTELAEKVLHGELKLGGSRRECAVFFSDIRNFTATSEGMEPEDVVEFLNHYMTDMVACVNQKKGVVDKFIGDSIMAVWGAINTTENDTENAIDAALLMREALVKLNLNRKNNKMPYIRMGIGINTGPVIAGQIGSDERLEFTVVGDAVNLASRIESLNKDFNTDILISDSSLEKVKGIYDVVKMKSIHVKGKQKAQTIYAVLGRKGSKSTPANLTELRKLVEQGFEPKSNPKTLASTKSNQVSPKKSVPKKSSKRSKPK